MAANGFNPMDWNCHQSGCFNVKRRPKIEVFADCFPRRINFGDVDGLVELSGVFAMLEWKGQGGSLRKGQELTYQAFTKQPGNIVFVIEGDAETMIVQRYCIFWQGRQHPWQAADLAEIQNRIRGWVDYTQKRARQAA